MKLALIDANFEEGLTDVLQQLGASSTVAAEYCRRWAKGDRRIRKKVAAKLKRAGMDSGVIVAKTVAAMMGRIERLDRMSAQSEARRAAMSREIERFRATMGSGEEDETGEVDEGGLAGELDELDGTRTQSPASDPAVKGPLEAGGPSSNRDASESRHETGGKIDDE